MILLVCAAQDGDKFEGKLVNVLVWRAFMRLRPSACVSTGFADVRRSKQATIKQAHRVMTEPAKEIHIRIHTTTDGK